MDIKLKRKRIRRMQRGLYVFIIKVIWWKIGHLFSLGPKAFLRQVFVNPIRFKINRMRFPLGMNARLREENQDKWVWVSMEPSKHVVSKLLGLIPTKGQKEFPMVVYVHIPPITISKFWQIIISLVERTESFLERRNGWKRKNDITC